jgi:formylmethanofuran dehydrogenase subunit E
MKLFKRKSKVSGNNSNIFETLSLREKVEKLETEINKLRRQINCSHKEVKYYLVTYTYLTGESIRYRVICKDCGKLLYVINEKEKLEREICDMENKIEKAKEKLKQL